MRSLYYLDTALMGKDSELFKAAQTGNNALLERAFASYLKKQSGQGGGTGHGFGRCVGVCVGVYLYTS